MKLIEYAIQGKFILIVSQPILEEFKEKLVEKFNYSLEEAKKAAEVIIENALLVKISGTLKGISIDPDDNLVMDTSKISDAQYIVTGDHHLLDIKEYKGIKIIKAAEFLNLLEKI
ncbi:MAG: putative toxin-antitoxin system toxin component, PIN family [Firmicutes bacterium]|nr:putative toxin-antitoxin system toxin component, PIN family [Bacillota bacterium]